MHQYENERKDTLETVYELDRQLVKEYQVSEAGTLEKGNAESRTAFITYGLTTIGLSILGDKGISKIGNIAKLGNMAAKSAEYIPKVHKSSPVPVLAGGPAVSKPVPYNVLNNLLTQIKTKVDEVFGSGKGTGEFTEGVSKAFEKEISKMSTNERVAAVKAMAKEICDKHGFIKDKKLTRINGRDVYRDIQTGNLYAVDSQHGRFEMLNTKGKHLGEVNFDFEQTKPADNSGKHNLRMK